MPIEVVTPSDVPELVKELHVVPRPVGSSPDPTQFAVYRGCASEAWQLEHSLSRTDGDFAAKEESILDDFRVYASRITFDTPYDLTDDLQVMALSQHYGVPTRLLDWTKDPNVALHFATSTYQHSATDGALWVVNPHLVHAETLAPGVRQKLCPGRPDDPQVLNYSKVLETYPNLTDFDTHFKAGVYTPTIFFEPAKFDDRITHQKGLFSLVGDPKTHALEVLKSLDGACRKVIIAANLKDEVRKMLDAQESDERMFFPGLDGIGRFLTRTYAE